MDLANKLTKDSLNTIDLACQSLVINHSFSFITSMSLKCAVQLEIPNHIHSFGRPMPLYNLSLAIPIPPSKVPKLYRLMRLLVEQNVFNMPSEGVYDLAPISRNLLTDRPNMVAWFGLLDCEFFKPWTFLSEWFKSEGSLTTFEMANEGKSIWDVMSGNPNMAKPFNEAMANQSKQIVTNVVEQYPELFKGVKTLVDVGGGSGTAATIIAGAFPGLRCTVFDLPHVIASLPETDVFDKVAGSMFETIPPADAILLQSVLHNWEDEECVNILKRIKEVIPRKENGGKVLILENVVNSRNDCTPKAKETILFADLQMMTMVNGKEREEEEWKSIFNQAGFARYKIHPTFGVGSVIELHA